MKFLQFLDCLIKCFFMFCLTRRIEKFLIDIHLELRNLNIQTCLCIWSSKTYHLEILISNFFRQNVKNSIHVLHLFIKNRKAFFYRFLLLNINSKLCEITFFNLSFQYFIKFFSFVVITLN